MLDVALRFIQPAFGIKSAADRKRQRAERASARRIEAIRLVGAELDALANLMSEVLSSSDPNGVIDTSRLEDLDQLRKRCWNRWQEILESGSFQQLDEGTRCEVENAVTIAHAAPGAYIKEVYFVQMVLAERSLPPTIRQKFASSIARIRDLGTRLRLAA